MDKINCNTYFHEFISAILAGIMISIGGTVYLSIENKIIGSLFFSIGLFVILTFQLNLFTGKVGYLVNNSPFYLFDLFSIWLGNFFGTDLYCTVLYPFKSNLTIKATLMCNDKILQSIPQAFVLSLFCGLLMYIACNNFKMSESELSKYIGIFLCVSVFIICGFEHCVADMFYFGMANGMKDTSPQVLKYICVITFGNSIGSFILPLYQKFEMRNTNK